MSPSSLNLQPQMELLTSSSRGFEVRKSRRARRLSIQVHAQGYVEVVVPARTSPSRVRAFVQANREWIDRALSSLAKEFPPEEFALPEEIHLAAIGARFDVQYEDASNVAIKSYGSNVVAQGSSSQEAEIRDGLKDWVKARGKHHLLPWLARVAEETGLSYRRVQVRGQSTRWGSCSAKGTISLNYGLMFVAPELVRYLLVHELCHTVHMNHSKKFWSLVDKHQPDHKRLDQLLDGSWRLVPGWARI